MSEKKELLEQFVQAVFNKMKAEGRTPRSVFVEDPMEGLNVIIVDLRDTAIPVLTGTEAMQHLQTSISFPCGTVMVCREVEL